MHQQIQSLKLLTRGHSLNHTQIQHIHKLPPEDLEAFQSSVAHYLVRSKSLQASELTAFSYDQVPGDLTLKSSDFFCEMRVAHLENMRKTARGQVEEEIGREIAMLRLRKQQGEAREVIKEEWMMREEVNRDKSHGCLEVALLDREFYTRKQVTQDLKSKQELKIAAKCEQAMRNGHEQKKKNKENQFLADLLNHHREFFDFHRKKHVFTR